MRDWERGQKIREAYRNAGLELPADEPLADRHAVHKSEVARVMRNAKRIGVTRQTAAERIGPANCGSRNVMTMSAYLVLYADDGTVVMHHSSINSGDAITNAWNAYASQTNGARGGRPPRPRVGDGPSKVVNVAGMIVERGNVRET